jgi:hypothetical protein
MREKIERDIAVGLRRAGRTSLADSRGVMAEMMLAGGFSVGHVRAVGATVATVIFDPLTDLIGRDNAVRFVRQFDVR